MIETKIEGTKLVVTMDLDSKGQPSSTGKTILVESTRGSIAVDYPDRPGMKLSINLTVPA